MKHRIFSCVFLFVSLLFDPFVFDPLVFGADDSPEAVKTTDAAATTDDAVLRLADSLEERVLRNELLTDLAKARVFEGHIKDALAAAERVEPARDRKSLLRQLAWLAVEVRREGNPSPLFVDNAVRTKEWETAVDRVLPVLDRLVAEDGTQAFLAGEIAISLLTKPRGDFDLPVLMPVFHGLDFNGIRIVRPFDGCCEQALRLVDHFGKPSADASASSPSSFESNRRAYDFVVALAKAGAVEEAWSRIDSLESTEFRDWAKLAVLEAGKGWKPASQATQTGAAGIVDMEKIEEFATPEKRAWALLSLERVQRDFKIRQALLLSSSRAASDDPRLHVTHADYALLEQAAEIARMIEDPEHRSVQLRILAKDFLLAGELLFGDRQEELRRHRREQGLPLLRDAEAAAGEAEPLFRRLELLAFVARAYRLYLPEDKRHEEIAQRIREEIDRADKRMLTVQERLHLLESVGQALGEPPMPKIVVLAEGNPKAAAKVGEMLLRNARLYDSGSYGVENTASEIQGRKPPVSAPLPGLRPYERPLNQPTGEPDVDRMQLPFDVYEEYYYSPFTVEGDCGC